MKRDEEMEVADDEPPHQVTVTMHKRKVSEMTVVN